MNATLESSKAELHRIAERMREGIESGKYSMNEVRAAVTAKSKKAAAVTDAYVHENAWKAVGIAALAGLIIGAALTRGAEEDERAEMEREPRQPREESDFNLLEILQTAMPLALFAMKTYNKVQQHRRNSAGPVM